MTTEKKDDDFLSKMLAPPADIGTDAIIACFPGMAASSAEIEERERRYFADPFTYLPLPFEEAEGECDPLGPHELKMIADFNARFGVAFTEADWRTLNNYPALPTQKE